MRMLAKSRILPKMKIYKIPDGVRKIIVNKEGKPSYLKKTLVEINKEDWVLVDEIEPLPEEKHD